MHDIDEQLPAEHRGSISHLPFEAQCPLKLNPIGLVFATSDGEFKLKA